MTMLYGNVQLGDRRVRQIVVDRMFVECSLYLSENVVTHTELLKIDIYLQGEGATICILEDLETF